MVPHIHYVEPFFGGGAVLLAKDPIGVSEVINDLNRELMDFWRCLANENAFGRLVRILQATPCSEGLYQDADFSKDLSVDPVYRAAGFFVRCRQSRAATFKGFSTLAKTRTRRGMNELPSAWWNAVDCLPEIHARLSRVVMLNRTAIECIETQDGPGTLFFCDPPYVHETRKATDAYEHEMTVEQHAELLEVLCACKGKVMLSGYDCDLYAKRLAKWTRHAWEIPNHSAGGDSKRKMTEVLWCNW